jgi:hypothetical protein
MDAVATNLVLVFSYGRRESKVSTWRDHLSLVIAGEILTRDMQLDVSPFCSVAPTAPA